MAKRRPLSQVNDAPGAPAQPKRRGQAVKELGPETVAGREGAPDMAEEFRNADTQEPRSDPQPMDTDSLSMSSEPHEEDIRMRAYQMYLERGGGHGGDFDDWVRAERELKKSGG